MDGEVELFLIIFAIIDFIILVVNTWQVMKYVKLQNSISSNSISKMSQVSEPDSYYETQVVNPNPVKRIKKRQRPRQRQIIPAPIVKINPNPAPVAPPVPMCNVCKRPIDAHTIGEAKQCGIIEQV